MPDSSASEQDARIVAASIRDVPASCTCTWDWIPAEHRAVLSEVNPDCPWHITRKETT